jgi:DNA-binding transcriptional regulator YiaG
MPNIASVLKEEIQRLARKQVKAVVGPLRRDSIRLKKSVADLRRQIAALDRASRDVLTRVAPIVETEQTQKTSEEAARLRPTSKSLEKLRKRLGLTQVQFGRLLGVSGQAVVRWAGMDGRVRMRRSTLSALAGIQRIGKREARRRLETIAGLTKARRGPRRGAARTQ